MFASRLVFIACFVLIFELMTYHSAEGCLLAPLFSSIFKTKNNIQINNKATSSSVSTNQVMPCPPCPPCPEKPREKIPESSVIPPEEEDDTEPKITTPSTPKVSSRKPRGPKGQTRPNSKPNQPGTPSPHDHPSRNPGENQPDTPKSPMNYPHHHHYHRHNGPHHPGFNPQNPENPNHHWPHLPSGVPGTQPVPNPPEQYPYGPYDPSFIPEYYEPEFSPSLIYSSQKGVSCQEQCASLKYNRPAHVQCLNTCLAKRCDACANHCIKDHCVCSGKCSLTARDKNTCDARLKMCRDKCVQKIKNCNPCFAA